MKKKSQSSSKYCDTIYNLIRLINSIEDIIAEYNTKNTTSLMVKIGSSIGETTIFRVGVNSKTNDIFSDTANCASRVANLDLSNLQKKATKHHLI
ncbi:MAG: hypothetical protein MHPSP_003975, partial [Paramarteilia canceri]